VISSKNYDMVVNYRTRYVIIDDESRKEVKNETLTIQTNRSMLKINRI